MADRGQLAGNRLTGDRKRMPHGLHPALSLTHLVLTRLSASQGPLAEGIARVLCEHVDQEKKK